MDHPDTDDLRERRGTFNAVARLYDRARPTYPPILVDDLVAYCGIGPRSRVLEIGPGTGQLTRALAGYGCHLDAVELGPDLAATTRHNLAAFPRTHVAVAAFEEWPLPPEPFDVVVAATSFHWLDPLLRVEKSAAALRPGGALATIATHHVAGGTADFFTEAQTCYQQWDPTTLPDSRLPLAAEIPADQELEQSNHFAAARFRRYEQDITYSTSAYLDTLRTYSPTRALPPHARDGLLHCLAAVIDNKYGGTVVKRYMHELRIARRRD
ncbi:MAG: class I SAM-dependent methyltransferase [Pseudonocardiaceae bacterium]